MKTQINKIAIAISTLIISFSCTDSSKLKIGKSIIDFDKNKGYYYYLLNFIDSNSHEIDYVFKDEIYFRGIKKGLPVDSLNKTILRELDTVFKIMNKFPIHHFGITNADTSNTFEINFRKSIYYYNLRYYRKKDGCVNHPSCLLIDSNWAIWTARIGSI